MIPNGWKATKLGDVSSINYSSLTEDTPEQYEMYYIDLSSVKNGIVEFPQKTTTFIAAPSRARRVARSGDVIVATVRPNLQGYAHLKNVPGNTICSTGFAVISAKDSADAGFIYQSLYGRSIQTQIANLVVGSNYPAINSSDVKNLSLCLPPLNEQKHIAEVLSSVDAAIEATRAVIAQTKKVKQGLLQTLLTQGIGHTKFKDSSLGKIPERWKCIKLEDIFRGGMVSDGDWIESKDQDPEGNIRLVQLADIGDGVFLDKSSRFINQNTFKALKCTALNPGDILVARMPDPLGRCCIFPDNQPQSITAVDVCIMRPNAELADNHWVANLINAPFMRSTILQLASGTTRQRVTKRSLLDLYVPYPPLEEQKRMSAVLNGVDASLDEETKKLQAFSKLKIGLMQDLLTGKVRVHG